MTEVHDALKGDKANFYLHGKYIAYTPLRLI